MLLRTVVVLLLCVSSGLCATLGHYQTEEREVGAPAVDSNLSDSAETTDGATHTTDTRSPAPEPKLLVEEPAAAEADVNVPGPGGAPTDGGVKLPGEAVVQQEPSEEDDNELEPLQTKQSVNDSVAIEDNSWSINSIRNSFQKIHGYVDSLVELVGGRNGVCEYRCRHGEPPEPRPGYQHPEPNGCSSSLVGFQLDLGIPAMTKCCNHVDVCYDTCGTNKYDCDSKFRSCLHDLCSDLKRSLGFVSQVQACESMADTLYNTVWMLGCRPYMSSQRAACVCTGEQRDEL